MTRTFRTAVVLVPLDTRSAGRVFIRPMLVNVVLWRVWALVHGAVLASGVFDANVAHERTGNCASGDTV